MGTQAGAASAGLTTESTEIMPESSKWVKADGGSKKGSKPVLPKISGQITTGLISPQNPGVSAPAFPSGAKQRVILNFDKADIAEVSAQIFGDYLKMNYVLDPGLQGRVSMYLEGDFSQQELFQMVSRAYEANNIGIVPQKGGIYYIQPLQRSSSSGLQIAGDFTLRDTSDASRPVIVMYRLKYIDAKQAINTIRFFLTPGRPVTSDSLGNTLIFVEDKNNARTIVDVLRALDVNVLQELSMEIVPVRSISPQDAVQSVEAMMGKMGMFKDSSLKGGLAFVPLLSFGGVLVLAQSPDLLKNAKAWISALDVQGSESGEQIYIYFVQNGLAKDIGDILNQVYGLGSGGGTARPDQQVVRSTQRSFGGSTGGFGSTGFGNSGNSSLGGSSLGGSSLGGSSMGGSSFGNSSLGRTSSTGTSSGFNQSTFGRTTQQRSKTGIGGAGGTGRPATTLTGEVVIIPDEVNNAIVVRANAADYGKIKKTIETLDIIPRAVLVEMTLAEVTLDKNSEYGLQYLFRDIGMNIAGKDGSFAYSSGGGRISTNDTSGTGGTTVPGTPGGFLPAVATALNTPTLYWGSIDKSANVLLNLVASKNNVRVLSTPTLLATDNKEATITVGGREPIPMGSAVGTATADTLFSSIQYEETGIILSVIPHINAGGLIRLEVEQTIREVAESVRVGDVNNYAPRFTERNIKTTLLGQNGSTMVIGGIIMENESRGKSGIPFLQDVPIIAPLFTTKDSRSKKRTELIIAITPHVVDHRGSDQTREFLDKLNTLKTKMNVR